MRNFGRQAQLTSVLQEGLWRTALRVPSAPARLSNGCRCRRHDRVAEWPRRSRYRSTGEGMGRSTALTLAREGADVVLNHGTNRRTSAANNHRLVKAIEGLGTP